MIWGAGPAILIPTATNQGLGMEKSRLGKRPVSFAAAAGPAVASPTGRPDWKLRFAATFLFPR